MKKINKRRTSKSEVKPRFVFIGLIACTVLAACIGMFGCGGKDEEPETPEVVVEEPLPELEAPSLGMAVIDLERIYLGFHKTKALQAQIDKNIAAARDAGRPLLTEMQWLRTKITDPATNAVEAADLKRRGEEVKARLDEMTEAAPPVKIPEDQKQVILTELSQIIGEFMESKGFDVVLDKGVGGKYGPVTFPLGNLPDLTSHVIEHLQQVSP